jgi:HlyD family secretion protein
VPRTALFRSDEGDWRVMIVRHGRTELRAVSVGLMNDDWAEVRDGVSTAESVVLRPSREIVPGMRVAVEVREP